MDPLTHTLVGANLAATRLGRTTALAGVALIVGVNLPDIDAAVYFFDGNLGYGVRRGWTHGILAIALLPLLLAGFLAAIDRWFLNRDRPPASFPKLLILSFIAVLTHPALDWLNNYGMRWLMPFDATWFYGDAVFIMDPWLWLILGGSLLLGQRASKGMVVSWAVLSTLLGWVVSVRAPDYRIVVVAVSLVLLTMLLWRGRQPMSERSRGRLAIGGLICTGLFIGFLLGLQASSQQKVAAVLGDEHGLRVDKLMVAPTPLNPGRWVVVAQTDTAYRYGHYDWFDGGLELFDRELPVPTDDPIWQRVLGEPGVSGFLGWARFPWFEAVDRDDLTRVYVMDARYVQEVREGFGTVILEFEEGAKN